MSSVTYQTRVPDSLIPFCEAMAALMPVIERNLNQDLRRGRKLNDLKREYQIRYGINARQFNAVHAVLKGKIQSRVECHKRQINSLKAQIADLQKSIAAKEKRLTNRKRKDYAGFACPLTPSTRTPRAQLRFTIHQKKRKLHRLSAKLNQIQNTEPTILFGGRKLWKAQYNLEANGYQSHEQWLKDWQNYRNSQFYFVGSKDESAGCQVCQLNQDRTLKIRVPAALESQFGKYVTADGIRFAYGQADIDWVLTNHKAISYRFARKDDKWYIFASVDRPDVPYQTHRQNGMIGVDLNPDMVGWAYCDAQGNLKTKGQFPVNLQDLTTEQTKAVLGDVCTQLVILAESYGCPIVVENLDFDRKKASLKEKDSKYARMLSSFAYSCFDSILTSRCDRFGIELIHVNPAYSSAIGLVKFMAMYGLSSDTAAALVLARRALRLSERIPASLAPYLSVDKHRHSWSFWNALWKKLVGVRRHDFFRSRGANSAVVDMLLDEASSQGEARSGGKRQRTSTRGRDSRARIVDATAQSTLPSFA